MKITFPVYKLSACVGAIALTAMALMATAPGAHASGPSVCHRSCNVVTVTNPGTQTTSAGYLVHFLINATDSSIGAVLGYTAEGLPPGLSVNFADGAITGVATTTGSYKVTIGASDSTGASGSTTFTWVITNHTGNVITLANPGNQTSTLGEQINLPLQVTDSDPSQTLSYAASGLPGVPLMPGLGITPSGVITGTIDPQIPTPIAFPVTITVSDSTGAAAVVTFTWTVNS